MTTRYVFDFSEGDKDQKALLGGKGANLAEMVKIGLPVPPGFTITTDACRAYLTKGKAPKELEAEVTEHLATIEKAIASDDPDFKVRAMIIKEQRSHLVKEHLWVLWTDYFKAPHFEKYPQLHTLVNDATKAAGAAGTKGSWDLAKADELLAKIDEIAEIFWETKKA